MRPSADVMAAARKNREVAPVDKLVAITNKVREARDLASEIQTLTERVSEKKKAQYELLNRTIPDMMTEVRLRNFTLEREGNHAPFEVEVKPFVHANIQAEWPEEKKEAAFAWLRDNKLGDMIKNILTIEFGRGTAQQQKKVLAALSKLGISYRCERGVPWNTLTAWVREALEKKQPVPLDLLGVTVGTVAKLKEVKEKK